MGGEKSGKGLCWMGRRIGGCLDWKLSEVEEEDMHRKVESVRHPNMWVNPDFEWGEDEERAFAARELRASVEHCSRDVTAELLLLLSFAYYQAIQGYKTVYPLRSSSSRSIERARAADEEEEGQLSDLKVP